MAQIYNPITVLVVYLVYQSGIYIMHLPIINVHAVKQVDVQMLLKMFE